MGDGLREQIAEGLTGGIWYGLSRTDAEDIADDVIALPCIRELVEQAAEAARLRAVVERIRAEALRWQIPGDLRRALDGDGTDG